MITHHLVTGDSNKTEVGVIVGPKITFLDEKIDTKILSRKRS